MNPLDDFFAFASTDVSSQIEKKKKKKKKEKKKNNAVTVPKKEPSETDGDLMEIESQDDLTPPGPGKKSNVVPDIDNREIQETSVQDETMLTNLLGLSESPSGSQQITSTSENGETTGKAAQIEVDDAAAEDEEGDNFLDSLNSYMTTIAEKNMETHKLLKTQRETKFEIRGEEMEAKDVRFEFHVTIQAAGQICGSYDLQVKGSTRIEKIIRTLMPLFNQEANPTVPEQEWPTLRMYINELNVILGPELKCMSLLGYKHQLKQSNNVAGYELSALIAKEEYAQHLYEAEKTMLHSAEGDAGDRGSEKQDEGEYLTIAISDEHQKKSLDVITDIGSEEIGDTSEIIPLRTEMSVTQDMLISEICMLYKYKTQIPNNVEIKMFTKDGSLLKPESTLKEYNVEDGQVINVEYKMDEVQAEEGYLDYSDEDDNLTEVQGHETDKISKYDINIEDDDEHERTGGHFTDSKEDYFTIFVAGKDKKRYKVDVKPSTKVADIAKFYLQKAGLGESTKIKLLFDDEELDLGGVVADTELEDEFMIDAVL